MGLRSFIGLIAFGLVVSLVGCESDKAQKVEPETRGKRGERCQARNDCASGLACLNSICAKNEFDISVEANHCDRIECAENADCCGDRPTAAPAKCKGRDKICDPANQFIEGCIQTSCTSDAVCNGGTCNPGSCIYTGGACTSAADCADTCNQVTGTCTLSNNICTLNTQCTYYNINTCSARSCNCVNPAYMPTADICFDETCADICVLRCEDELCVEDNSCETAADCVGTGFPLCDGGRCVQCTEDAECDKDNNETCEKGLCEKPCEHDEECGLFEVCDAGDCLYVGCQSDRECILAAARGQDQGIGGSGNLGQIGVGDDPRLFKCLPSDSEENVNVCKIPCENDGSCGQFQVCDEGFCKFIGCKDATECRAYLGIANQQTSDIHPWVTTAVCRK